MARENLGAGPEHVDNPRLSTTPSLRADVPRGVELSRPMRMLAVTMRTGKRWGLQAGLVGVVVCVAEPADAQNMGNPATGLQFARSVCAECHAVEIKQPGSPNTAAPSFQRIANIPGMTETALYVSLQTSHRTMPNLRLEADEMRDVVAYILSLKPGP